MSFTFISFSVSSINVTGKPEILQLLSVHVVTISSLKYIFLKV